MMRSWYASTLAVSLVMGNRTPCALESRRILSRHVQSHVCNLMLSISCVQSHAVQSHAVQLMLFKLTCACYPGSCCSRPYCPSTHPATALAATPIHNRVHVPSALGPGPEIRVSQGLFPIQLLRKLLLLLVQDPFLAVEEPGIVVCAPLVFLATKPVEPAAHPPAPAVLGVTLCRGAAVGSGSARAKRWTGNRAAGAAVAAAVLLAVVPIQDMVGSSFGVRCEADSLLARDRADCRGWRVLGERFSVGSRDARQRFSAASRATRRRTSNGDG